MALHPVFVKTRIRACFSAPRGALREERSPQGELGKHGTSRGASPDWATSSGETEESGPIRKGGRDRVNADRSDGSAQERIRSSRDLPARHIRVADFGIEVAASRSPTVFHPSSEGVASPVDAGGS